MHKRPSGRTISRAASQSGQIGIIIVLIMVVLLTIGLSLASRSTRDVALSQQEEESTRIFNAAEAGIEQALSTDLNFAGEQLPGTIQLPDANATVDYTISKNHVLETRLFQGMTAKVQLQDATTAPPPNLYIDWAKETTCTGVSTTQPASIVVSIYSIDTSVAPQKVTLRHLAFAGCDHGDGTAVAGAGSNGYSRRATIPLQANDSFLRIKPVYNDTSIRVTPSAGTLPVQAYDIRSSGTNNSGAENRIVEVNRTLSSSPSVFDFVLYSGTTLTK